MEDWPDEELVREAKRGDVDSFMELAKRYQEMIYKMVLSMTGNHLDADDLSQETFLRAFRSMKGFRGESSFYTWLYRIAVNLTYNFLKKTRREKHRREMDWDAMLTSLESQTAGGSPEKKSILQGYRNILLEAIGSLPLVYKTAFILVELQGLTHKQAAEILKCSENTVSWRIHRARKMLRDRLPPPQERGRS